MEAYKGLVAAPIVVAFLWIGATEVNAQAGLELFALFWWAMMSALTVCFVVLIRWGMGEDRAPAPAEAAAPEGARQASVGQPPVRG